MCGSLSTLQVRSLTAQPFGGAEGSRTPDLLDANETRYQLRHSPGTTAMGGRPVKRENRNIAPRAPSNQAPGPARAND